jgi:hypothetical protein
MRYANQRRGASSLPWLKAGIGVLVCVAAFTLASLHTDPAISSQVTGMPHANSANHSSAPTVPYQGATAITPHLNMAANAASTANGGTATLPAFTAADASAWVMSNKYFYEATGTLTVESVTFLPYEQASQWLSLGFGGVLAVTPMCVVVLDGNFTDTLDSVSTQPATYSHVIDVFNAVTGNLMRRALTNSLPAAPATPTTPATPGTGTSTPTS